MTRAVPHALTRALTRAVSRASASRGTVQPRHRALGEASRTRSTPVAARHRVDRSSTPLRRFAAAGAVLAATGVVVASGTAAGYPASGTSPADAGPGAATGVPTFALSAAEVTTTPDADVLDRLRSDRTRRASRSAERTLVDPTKLERLKGEAESGGQLTRTKDLGSGDPKAVARSMLAEFGFSADQFDCLDSLWTKESGWDPRADNPTSSAYGIPQALPGSKMATAGADWATNPATQISWGLGYIRDRYGSPCAAWSHSEANNWY